MDQVWNFLLTILSIIFVFVAVGFCIFSHELGHFLAGKLMGLHIDAFSIGFKAFWKKKYHNVEYRLGYLPIGGYVELPQIDCSDDVPKAADGTALPRASAWARIVTAAAGPFFNIISGLLIGCIVWAVGLPQDTPKMREITILDIDENGPEYAAGLRKNDRIVKINGSSFNVSWRGFVEKILFTIGQVELEVERDGRTFAVRYTPKPNPKAYTSRAEGVVWPYFTPFIPIELHPEKNSIAGKAGIQKGDFLVALNHEPIAELTDFQFQLDLNGAKPVLLTLRRNGKLFHLTLTPEPVKGLGEEFTRYLTGIHIAPGKNGKNVQIASVLKASPAEKAGLRPGDVIEKADETALNAPADFIQHLQSKKTAPVKLQIRRGNSLLSITVAAQKIIPYTIGATVASTEHPNPFRQFFYTVQTSYQSLRGILIHVGNGLGMTQKTSSLKPSHMSGPLGIGLVLYNSVRYAPFIHTVNFIVFFSFALAIFNLLPLPVLDGGHIFFGFLELITRRTLPIKLMKILSNTFVALLIMLMVFVTFSDVKRLVRVFVPDAFMSVQMQTQEKSHDK